MSLLKKLAGLAVGAAAVGAAGLCYCRTVRITTTSTSIFGVRRTRSSLRPIPPSPLTMRPLWLNPPPPHLKNLPSPPRRKSPRNLRKLKRPPPRKAADYDTPNVNPVELGHTEAPRTADGKIDPTQIVDPAVAGDWEEQGCKGLIHQQRRKAHLCFMAKVRLFVFVAAGSRRGGHGTARPTQVPRP